ncbi:MAG: hypothetical protein ACM3SW_07490 [Actinomycetota bacterium]
MSWNVGLFISGDSPLEKLAHEISNILGIHLKRDVGTDGGIRFNNCTPNGEIIPYADHGLINDRDMHFEKYKYQLIFWRLNPQDREQAQRNTLDLGWKVFDALKQSGMYQLMLVENAQKKLASFSPS